MIELMKSCLRVSFVGFVCLLLFGCLALAPKPISPLDLPLGTPTPSSYRTYTDTLTLPDGRVLPVECRVSDPNVSCYAIFPNGNEMPVGNRWSPDKRFVHVCTLAYHDSPCLGYQIWDVVSGEKILDINPYYWHQWAPDQPHTMVIALTSEMSGTQSHLVFFDAATRQETYPVACPDWFLQAASYRARQVCHNVGRSALPTPTW